jgi:hypothetical protein
VASAADFELGRVVVTIFEVPADKMKPAGSSDQWANAGHEGDPLQHHQTPGDELGCPWIKLGSPDPEHSRLRREMESLKAENALRGEKLAGLRVSLNSSDAARPNGWSSARLWVRRGKWWHSFAWPIQGCCRSLVLDEPALPRHVQANRLFSAFPQQ